MTTIQNHIENVIKTSSLEHEPYPHVVIDNFLPDEFVKKFELPGYSEIEPNVPYQDIYKTKKGIADNVTDLRSFDAMLEIPQFKIFNDILKNPSIYNILKEKFKTQLQSNLAINIDDLQITPSVVYSVSKPGYSKEIHLDRREHIISILYYVSEDYDSAKLQLWKHPLNLKCNDVFPKSSELILSKTYNAKKNSAVIILNTPDSYHSVTRQEDNFLERKYLYVVWDYESGSRKKKECNNDSEIWKKKVKVFDESRRENFFKLVKN